jgi:protease-4
MSPAPTFDPDQPSRHPAPTVVVHTHAGGWRTWLIRLLVVLLACSLLFNLVLFAAYREYFADIEAPQEKFHSGSVTAQDEIVILKMTGTIMPPFSERLRKQIEHVGKTDSVKGVLLVIDSPGGFVGDSHEIYHHLKKLAEKDKPVYVAMKGMAASGGYYIAMGAGPQGKLFAEPTTWTGSIGVIIPRYDISRLADKFGFTADPLKTGEFKDALSPFRPLSDSERKIWENILNQAFDQFLEVIDLNRDNLTLDQVRQLATGEVFTAKDALANGLIDAIGFEDEALEQLKALLVQKGKIASADQVRVVTYSHPPTVVDLLLGRAALPAGSRDPLHGLLESSVPRALYYCSWLPPLPE